MLPEKRSGGAEDGAAAIGDEGSSVKRATGLNSGDSSLISPSPSPSPLSLDNPRPTNGMEIDGPAATNGGGVPPEIDEDLHSWQLAVYGRETMRRLFASNVLVSGLNGLGVEIAKNLVLAGVKSVTLHDEGSVELWDLSSNFYFSEDDVGKNRAIACIQKLQELNSAVLVSTLTGALSKEQLSDFQAVVFTDISLEKAVEFDDFCHEHQPPISFIKLKYEASLVVCFVTLVLSSRSLMLTERNLMQV